jgi:hypothetical protein
MRRVILAAVAAGIAVVAMFAPASMADANPLPLAPTVKTSAPDPNTTGSQELATCLETAHTFSALFVLDMSGSLSTTDPNGVRYQGLDAALEGLSQLTSANGSSLTVQVAVAAFDNTYRNANSIVGWQRINGTNPPITPAQIVQQAQARTPPSGGTDFGAALQGAKQDLSDRGGPGTCRAILFFTDGFWTDSTNGSVTAAVCNAGGVMDQLRSASVSLIGLQYSVPGSYDPSANTGELAAMALGSKGGTSCGTNPIPEGSRTGVFLNASDSASIKQLFRSAINLLAGCTPTGSRGGHIDPGIRRVRVVLTTPRLANKVTFSLPGGVSFTAPADGKFASQGWTTVATRDDDYVQIDVTPPKGDGAGDWLVNADVPVSPQNTEFCVFADLHLGIDAASIKNLEAGQAGVVGVLALNPNGSVGSLAPFTVEAGGATAIGGDGTPLVTQLPVENVAKNGLDVLLQTRPADARIDFAMSGVTLVTKSGLALTPMTLDVPIIAKLSEDYPTISPIDTLQLGDALRTNPISTTLKLIGSSKGPTQVCLGAVKHVVLPSDARSANPFYPTGCVSLATGEVRKITVTVLTTQAVEGDGYADIPITLKPWADPKAKNPNAVFSLPVEWRFTNPLNVGILIWSLLIVIAISILIPLIAILWANWVTARFDVTNLRAAEIPVTIDRQGINLVTPIAGTDTIVSGFQGKRFGRRSIILVGRRLARRFVVGQVTFRSHTSWNPFRPAKFWVEAPEGTVLLSSFGQSSGRDVRKNRAPFGPAFSAAALWISEAATIPASGPVRGTLIVLTTTGGRRTDTSDPEDLVRTTQWATLLERYRSPITGAAGPDIRGTGGAGPTIISGPPTTGGGSGKGVGPRIQPPPL